METSESDAGRGPSPLSRSRRLAAFAPCHLPEILTAVAFVTARADFFADGGRIAVADPEQVAPFPWLRQDFLQTIWNLHTQPPLFNFLVGLGLQVPRVPLAWSLGAVYLVAGALLTWGVFRLVVELGASRWSAAAAGIVVGCSPSVLLYESWLTYDFLVALGVLWTVLLFLRWAETGRPRTLWGLCGCAAALVLGRALFVAPWFLLVVGAALWARRPRWRLLPAVLVPLVVITVFVVKDAVLFDQAGLSSWFGMNFSNVAVRPLPRSVVTTLIQHDGVPRVERVDSFMPYADYAPFEPACRVPQNDPLLLREPLRPNGRPNLEYACYEPVYRQFQTGALRAAFARPARFLRSEGETYQIFLLPTWRYFPLRHSRNGELLRTWTGVYEHSVTPIVSVPALWPMTSLDFQYLLYTNGPGGGRLYLDLTGALSLLATLAAGLAGAYRWMRRGRTPRRLGLTFAGAMALYVTVVGNLFESGENMRFREGIEPLCLAVFAVCIDRLVRSAWRRGHRAGQTVAPEAADLSEAPLAASTTAP